MSGKQMLGAADNHGQHLSTGDARPGIERGRRLALDDAGVGCSRYVVVGVEVPRVIRVHVGKCGFHALVNGLFRKPYR